MEETTLGGQPLSVPIEGTWVVFVFLGFSPSGKTRVYEVDTKDDVRVRLGEVRWYARWRKYAFFPDGETLYEQDCLRDIAEFLEGLMVERRVRNKATRYV